MDIVQTTFQAIDSEKFGIVILGCAIEGDLGQGWINGVTGELVDAGILPAGTTVEQAWETAQYTTSTGGRNDLVLYAKDPDLFSIGIMAMWRLTYVGQISWIDDWKVNYADHYGFASPLDLPDEDDEETLRRGETPSRGRLH